MILSDDSQAADGTIKGRNISWQFNEKGWLSRLSTECLRGAMFHNQGMEGNYS